MKADEMVSAVRKSAEIDTYDHAEAAVKATFAVLGQRLGSESSDLAAQLPPELTEDMDTSAEVERFSLDDFYERVAEREGHGCSARDARRHARAVTALLREAVGAEYLHVLSQLPDDWDDLVHDTGIKY